jgi:hypothetical protein
MTSALRAVLGLLFLAAGLMHLVLSSMAIHEAIESRSWSTTAGEITSAKVLSGRSSQPAVEYIFQVSEKRYVGSRREVKDYGTGRTAAEAVLAAYPVGSRIKVYFDPSDPTRSVLKPGITPFLASWPALSTLLTGMGAFLLVKGRRTKSDA